MNNINVSKVKDKDETTRHKCYNNEVTIDSSFYNKINKVVDVEFDSSLLGHVTKFCIMS